MKTWADQCLETARMLEGQVDRLLGTWHHLPKGQKKQEVNEIHNWLKVLTKELDAARTANLKKDSVT